MKEEEKEEQTILKLKDFIINNYNKLQFLSKLITSNNIMKDDLLQDCVLSIWDMHKCPENIFINKKEMNYLYGILIRTYYSDKFQNKYKLNDWINGDKIDKDEEEKQTDVYENIYHLLIEMQLKGEIELYDFKIFLLYYYPEYSIYHIRLNEEKYLKLNKKQTYRNIEEITDINFQSIRWTILKLMKKLKQKIIK